jgi:hypothetical protein
VPAQLYPVYVTEIVRCTCRAISRRREILGPACEHDPRTGELVDALSRRPGKPTTGRSAGSSCNWAWPSSANKVPQAVNELTKSLMAAGTFDHPLTSVGLLELGKLAFEAGKYDAAMTFCHEATLSAAFFDRYEVMEEAFRLGGLATSCPARRGLSAAAARCPASQVPVVRVDLHGDGRLPHDQRRF